MKSILIKIIPILLLASCNFNTINIDEIATIDVYDDYNKNLNIGKSISNFGWKKGIMDRIPSITKEDLNEIKLFINTLPEEKIIKIQLRTDHNFDSQKYSQIRGVFIHEINNYIKTYKENRVLIMNVSKKVDSYINLVNNEKYLDLYNCFHSSAKEIITFQDFYNIMLKATKYGLSKKSREYARTIFYDFKEDDIELDVIEFHFKHKKSSFNYESFNFKNINGRMEFIGYKFN